LKTSFDIGKVTSAYSINPKAVLPTDTPFSFEGLSLALLFTTSTYASQSYQTSVDGQAYNSSATNASSTAVSTANIAVGNSSACDFVFGGNYTLTRGENNETHTAVTELHPAKAEAVALAELPISIYQPALAQISIFGNYLNLTDLFGGHWPNVAIDYRASSFIYRVCFPTWDGQQIIHDPIFRGYMAASTQISESPSPSSSVIPSQSSTSIINPNETPSSSPTEQSTPTREQSSIPNLTLEDLNLGKVMVGAVIAIVVPALLIYIAKRGWLKQWKKPSWQ
ncbi:MAG: hypothetical protein ACQXXJ_01875, partial [Candidatus Bathyarchaeia archaeon]